MNILVTGGLGFIGHNVVKNLERLGHTCLITDIRTNYDLFNQYDINFLIAQRKTKIKTERIYKIDVANPDVEWIFKQHQIDQIIHLASPSNQKIVSHIPQWSARVMNEGLYNLLLLGVKYKIKKFVYISSSMVYGDFSQNYIEESSNCNPIGSYGIFKLAGEKLVQDVNRNFQLPYTIIRPSAVYGPLDNNDRVINKFLLSVFKKVPLEVKGANEVLDFTYVDDTANGIAQAAISENTYNKIYNITKSNSFPYTLEYAAKTAIKIAGQGTYTILERDSSYPKRGLLSIESAKNDFNFKPKVDLEDGMKVVYSWIKYLSIDG